MAYGLKASSCHPLMVKNKNILNFYEIEARSNFRAGLTFLCICTIKSLKIDLLIFLSKFNSKTVTGS